MGGIVDLSIFEREDVKEAFTVEARARAIKCFAFKWITYEASYSISVIC